MDKRLIAEMLDDLGIDYVEGGYPRRQFRPTPSSFRKSPSSTMPPSPHSA